MQGNFVQQLVCLHRIAKEGNVIEWNPIPVWYSSQRLPFRRCKSLPSKHRHLLRSIHVDVAMPMSAVPKSHFVSREFVRLGVDENRLAPNRRNYRDQTIGDKSKRMQQRRRVREYAGRGDESSRKWGTWGWSANWIDEMDGEGRRRGVRFKDFNPSIVMDEIEKLSKKSNRIAYIWFALCIHWIWLIASTWRMVCLWPLTHPIEWESPFQCPSAHVNPSIDTNSN